ncbi:MAG: PaaI family thioesterase [Victivallales bacterium]|nr:PaaI family thioesterase [Victivallales bacterium]
MQFKASDDGEVTAIFKGSYLLQGYNGILHGGVIASLLDSAMTNCLFQQGINAVTGELNVRYRHSIPCNAALELRARVASEIPPLFRMKAELLMNGKVMAHATAKFMQLSSLPKTEYI